MVRIFLRFLILLLALFSTIRISAQVRKRASIQASPKQKTFILEDGKIEVEQGIGKDKERWVVFSDRAENTTYTKPGGETRFKTLNFMEAYFVTDRRGDFVELIKYDPSMVATPFNAKIPNKKSAQYYGWISADKLLTTKRALRDKKTKYYLRGMTCIKGEDFFRKTSEYVKNDSLMLFGTPDPKMPISSIPYRQLVYIYKQSEDGDRYLIGKSDQITADNASKMILGWVSKDVVQPWAHRLAITFSIFSDSAYLQKGKGKYAIDFDIEFYSDSSKAVRRAAMISTNPDSTLQKDRLRVRKSILSTTPVLDKIFPIYKKRALNDSTTIVKTTAFSDILDRRKNSIQNVLGKPIFYERYEQIRQNINNINIVFVIDGGISNGTFFPAVMSVVQNLELYFDSTKVFDRFNYGAVVYKDGLRGSCKKDNTLPLTSNYNTLLQFIVQKQTEVPYCNDSSLNQALFEGLVAAGKMLTPKPDDTNVIVLIGSTGDHLDFPKTSWNDVLTAVSYPQVRVLAFQTHSSPNPSYNNFVLQARDLVVKSSNHISELKKQKIVDLTDIIKDPYFELTEGDSGVYYLDYPSRSMTEGFVMFPKKGEIMAPYFLEKYTDVLLKQIAEDNARIVKRLEERFSTIGSRNTTIRNELAEYYPNMVNKLPDNFLRNYKSLGSNFLVTGYTPLLESIKNDSYYKYGLLLSEEEYMSMITTLEELGRKNKKYAIPSYGKLYRFYYKLIVKTVKKKKLHKSKRIDKMNFAEITELLTGYPAQGSIFKKFTMDDIREADEKLVSRDDLFNIIYKFRDKATKMREYVNNTSYKFFSLGQAYYWISGEDLF